MDFRAGNLPAPIGADFLVIKLIKMTEVTIYHVYGAGWESNNGVKINLLEGLALEEASPVVAHNPQTLAKSGPFSLKIAKILAIVGIVILAVYFAPNILALANFKLSGGEIEELTEATQNTSGRALPAFDPTLPKTNHLTISSIGVDTQIEEATYENYESALKKGVWRVSNFGEPDTTGAPIILAAHRFGYLAWTNTFRRESSFYNLPKVKVGDVITIDWQQREYSYGVYKTENGEAISDYSADLILYTCESLSGPERIFVYAKLIS